MRQENNTVLKILPNGIIDIEITTIYFDELGNELARRSWKRCVEPARYDDAREVLDEYHMGIVNSVWTQEVIEEFNKRKFCN